MAHISKENTYRDKSLPVDQRVADLLGRMTPEEKFRELGMHTTRDLIEDNAFSVIKADKFFKGIGIGAMQDPILEPEHNARFINSLQKYLIENTRLGIPALIVSECLHGFKSPGATMFPQAITLSSSWNDELMRDIADAVAREAYSCGTRQALAPDLDLAREPRWGRVEETYGEDPYLCGILGAAYIKGMQGERDIGKIAKNKLITTVKHFAAHGSPQSGINLAPVPVGERQLRDTYLPPFKKAIVQAGALSVMPAYSEIDGIPCSASEFLLRKILREEWNFEGYVFSDFEAIKMLYTFHKTAQTPEEAGLQALAAGMDLEAPKVFGFNKGLLHMAQEGKVDMALVDRAVTNVLRVKFICRLFDDPYVDEKAVVTTVNSLWHSKLALEAARESIVLLKNEDSILPLSDKLDSVAVIGPNAAVVQLGDYSVKKDRDVSLLQGITNRVSKETTVRYAKGCGLYGADRSGFEEAIRIARESQVAIVAIGTSSSITSGVGWGSKSDDKVTCGEGYDTVDLKLPGVQEELAREIAKTGTPVIVVLINGKPVTFEYIADHIPAIIEAWYPGEQGGNALAEMIFGDFSPSGKLTVSFPKVSGQSPLFYNHKPSAGGYYKKPGTPEDPGRDYVFNDTKPLYPFGHGLSYTSFEYSRLLISPKVIAAREKVSVSVDVKNSGLRDGKEVVQLYLNDVFSSTTTPVRALKGFKKIHLSAGEEKRVCFELGFEEMCLLDKDMKETVEPGVFEVMIDKLKDTFTVKLVFKEDPIG